jgi:hypothetical protein
MIFWAKTCSSGPPRRAVIRLDGEVQMSESRKRYTGGCLCGALRYEAHGAPTEAGYCYCADCRKASGSGFIPFMNFSAKSVRFTGQPRQFVSPAANGGEAVRNSCPVCSGLVFGGVVGESDSFTIYVGSLDDPSLFEPKMAIFNRSRPHWVPLPPGLTVFETMP